MVAPGVEAHAHQHVFSFRFDMAVDGGKNSVSEVNFRALPVGPGNPHGNAIGISETPLRTEAEAQRDMDFASARYWKVLNPSSRNGLGEPVAYKLVPGVNAPLMLDPHAPVALRAGFMSRHFWATQYADGELYAAGLFPTSTLAATACRIG
jgi:primary-amine oxidase